MNTRGLRGLFKTNSSGDDVYFTLTVHFPLRKEKEREWKGGKKREENKKKNREKKAPKEIIAIIYRHERLKESGRQSMFVCNIE